MKSDSKIMVKILSLAAALFMAFGAGGCADEILSEKEPSGGLLNEPEDGVCITVTVNAGKTVMTRAGIDPSYDDGDDEEFKLAKGNYHYLFLYDGSGNLIDIYPLKEDKVKTDGNTKDNVTKTLYSIVGAKAGDIGIEAYLEEVKEAFVVINTRMFDKVIISDLDKRAYSKANLLQQTLWQSDYDHPGQIKVDDDYYFTMTNTVFVQNVNGNNVLDYGYTIYPQNFYLNPDEALNDDALSNPTINIYVERIAAKYTLTFAPVTGMSNSVMAGPSVEVYDRLTTDNNSYNIESKTCESRIEILGYGVNALEKETSLFKNITAAGNYFTNWYNSSLFRSFWCVDKNYVINSTTRRNYPQQYRKALETDSVYNYHNGGYNDDGTLVLPDSNSNYVLKYFPFDHFINGKNIGKSFYSIENTFDNSAAPSTTDRSARLWNRGYLSAGTHMIVACRLQIKWPKEAGEGGADEFETRDLYYGQNSIFYSSAASILEAKLELFNRVILPGGTSSIRILDADWKGHTEKRPGSETFLENVTWNIGSVLWVNERDDASTARIATANDMTLIPAEISGGDGKLLIAPKNRDAYFWISPVGDDGKMAPGYKFDYNKIVSLFHKLIGAIEHFKDGYMYYAIPVLHNVSTFADASSWWRVGDIGVVRNNWYDVTINSISGIGRPVDDPEQPLIPELEAKREYINMTVEILDWHTVTENIPFVPW